VFLTSHVLDLVEKLCTHVGIVVHGKLVDQVGMAEIQAGGTLEDRFLKAAGADATAAPTLAWLEAPHS
jgi:ABC-2 type transport system ATP-binding protein